MVSLLAISNLTHICHLSLVILCRSVTNNTAFAHQFITLCFVLFTQKAFVCESNHLETALW